MKQFTQTINFILSVSALSLCAALNTDASTETNASQHRVVISAQSSAVSSDALVLQQQAIAAFERGGIRQAERLFLAAIDVKPNPVKSYLYLVDIYASQSRNVQQLHYLIQGIKQHPNNVELHQRLGRYYETHEQYSEALKAYQEAFRLSPKSATLAADLVSIYRKLGDTEHAEVMLEQEKALRVLGNDNLPQPVKTQP